jgi:hypothetical protein
MQCFSSFSQPTQPTFVGHGDFQNKRRDNHDTGAPFPVQAREYLSPERSLPAGPSLWTQRLPRYPAVLQCTPWLDRIDRRADAARVGE